MRLQACVQVNREGVCRLDMPPMKCWRDLTGGDEFAMAALQEVRLLWRCFSIISLLFDKIIFDVRMADWEDTAFVCSTEPAFF